MTSVLNRAAGVASNIANHTDPLEKFGKFVLATFDVVYYFDLIKNEATKAAANLARWEIKAGVSLFGAVNFINQLALWTVGTFDEYGNRKDQSYWHQFKDELQPQNRRTDVFVKLAGKAALLVGKGIEALQCLNTLSIIDLGAWAANTVGRIPVVGTFIMTTPLGILALIKNFFILGSTGAAAYRDIPAFLNFESDYARRNQKDVKTVLNPARNQPQDGNNQIIWNNYTPQSKVAHWNYLTADNVVRVCHDKMARLVNKGHQQQDQPNENTKMGFWQNRLYEAQTAEGNQQQLNDVVNRVKAYKVTKWQTRVNNERKTYWKLLIPVINNIAKAAILVLSTALVIATAAKLATAVAILTPVCLAIGGVATIAALTKSLYDADPMNQPKPVIVKSN